MIEINAHVDDPFGSLIESHFRREFPELTSLSCADVLDMLTGVIVGTKEHRYGPTPDPERLVRIRKVIRRAMEDKKPIPMLIPWGSLKADLTGDVDVAEVYALRRITCVARTVRKYHEPGIQAVIRVEDRSGYSLFAMDKDEDEVRREVDRYTANLVSLVRMLSPDGQVVAAPETGMSLGDRFDEFLKERRAAMLSYLKASDEIVRGNNPTEATGLREYGRLAELGWRGIVPAEQRDYYLDTYRRNYDDPDEGKALRRLALYLGQSLTRKHLGMSGKMDEWDDFVQLTFVPPVKGLPEGYDRNYAYQRTLPCSQARTHIMPWRGKGYLRIAGRDVTPKLTSFRDAETMSRLTESELNVTDGKSVVRVRTDYLVEE
jgi:hypothetical protein